VLPMHDIKAIRENPAAFDAGLARRGLEPLSPSLLAIDEQKRQTIQKLQDFQSKRNTLSKEVGMAMGKKDLPLAEKLKAEVTALKDAIASGEEQERVLTKQLDDALCVIPNVPLASVPDGKDEHDNVEVRTWGKKPEFAFTPAQHFDLGQALGLMDFEIAAKLSGARFVVLSGALAKMERALGAFMLDLHTNEFGYTETYAPLMLRDEAMYGVGQLPKFTEDLFKTTSGHWLIPTAEASLTNLVREQVLDEAKLPIRMTAFSPCFRAEAGAAGRDTRGMIRQHQFSKVELVSIVTPEQADAEHERMTACAEEVLKRLNLCYRTVVLCAGDMGFGSRKTYDIEVWLPGQNAFREISSCSQFGEFQARRMDARCKAEGAKSSRFVHTLNGSALAVGRTMVAILENYQNADGSVTIPEALRPYMGGGPTVIKKPG
jgi:seryl-tRNA synthetase